jgi:hypothetical protein
MLPISSWSKNKLSNKPALLATCFTLYSLLDHSSTLKKEAICSSESLVDFQRTTRRYIPEERTLHIKLIYFIVPSTMQPFCSLDLTLLQHGSASIGHPQVFHFLPKLLPAFTIRHTFFPIALFYIYVTVTFLLTLVIPPYTVT